MRIHYSIAHVLLTVLIAFKGTDLVILVVIIALVLFRVAAVNSLPEK